MSAPACDCAAEFLRHCLARPAPGATKMTIGSAMMLENRAFSRAHRGAQPFAPAASSRVNRTGVERLRWIEPAV